MTHISGSEQITHTTDEAGRLLSDIPCASCGYNLRGSAAQGQCPECGEDVVNSLKGDRLALADAAWLRKMSRGMLWFIAGTVMFLVSFPLSDYIHELMSRFFSSGLNSQRHYENELECFIWFLITVSMCIGIWQITSIEPGRWNCRVERRSRRLARWILLTLIPISFIEYMIFSVGVITYHRIYGYFYGFLELAVAPGYFFLGTYLASIACRIPSRPLVIQTSVVKWGLCTCKVLCFLSMIYVYFFIIRSVPNYGSPIMRLAQYILPLGRIGIPVFAVWAIVLMVLFHWVFRSAARRALGFADGDQLRAVS